MRPVFVRDSGAEWTRMQVSRSMQRCCAAAKIAPRAVFHDLRRSYGSLLLNAGANAEVTQELLGHEDMRDRIDDAHRYMEENKGAGKIVVLI